VSESQDGFPYLEQKIVVDLRIELLTGLHIGGNDTGIAIGGADRLVVRDPSTSWPYVPGSSLKGKLRSLCERAGLGNVRLEPDLSRRSPCECCRCGRCDVCAVFGVAAEVGQGQAAGGEGEVHAGAARLLVRDARLENDDEVGGWPYLDMPYTEVKTEVSIDRLTSAANPRQFERVPAGARFGTSLILNVYRGDPSERFARLVLDALALLSADALGGQGSRGYGAARLETVRATRLRITPEGLVADAIDRLGELPLLQRFDLGKRVAASAA